VLATGATTCPAVHYFPETDEGRVLRGTAPHRNRQSGIAHTLGLPDALFDYPVDTSRAVAKLHDSNTPTRTPDVRYVFVHAGGTIPFVASRLRSSTR
jgi:hypothetical protein